MGEASSTNDDLARVLEGTNGSQRWLKRGLIAMGVIALCAGGVAWRSANRPPLPARYVVAEVSKGDVTETVQATGTVQPILQVNIGAQVNGRVTRVAVDFNSIVKKGDVLAEIDPTIYGAQVSATQANIAAQKAQLESAKANAEASRLNFERVQKLFEQNLASKGELDAARGSYEVTKATAEASLATIGATRAQLTQGLTNVAFTKIYSPVDGIVVTRGVDPGATVVASFQSPTLFVIAQDLRKMKVLADVDEADVGKIREQMQADAVVDAFPGEVFRGVVTQVRYSPNNVQGVVTYSAVVEVDNRDEKLRPGMTSTITIRTRDAKATLRVPNAALRFKPSPPKDEGQKGTASPPPVTNEPALAKGKGRIYVITDTTLGREKSELKTVNIGITDGLFTQLTDESLPIGTKLVTDENDETPELKKQRGRKMF
jgi:HlyD family secretion protein